MSCSHYVICGPAHFTKKREGREGKGGSAGLCLPQPFWCVEPRQNSNGKSIRRQGEASVRRGACVQAGGELQRLISKRAPGLRAAAELSAGGRGAPEVPGKGGSLGTSLLPARACTGASAVATKGLTPVQEG